jgi:polyhydroxyalkanoate synthesis regulator phasin
MELDSNVILVVFGLIVLVLMAYIYIKDNESNRKMQAYAHAIDDLNRQIYNLEKKLATRMNKLTTDNSATSSSMQDEIEEGISERITPLAQTLGEMQENMKLFQDEYRGRIETLEIGMKSFTIPSNNSNIDTKKIHTLYAQGVSSENIARELRLSKTEVDFALKVAQYN